MHLPKAILPFICSAFFTSLSIAQQVMIKIDHLENKKGILQVAWFDSKNNFLLDSLAVYHKQFNVDSRSDSVWATFDGIKPGKYAVAVFLDENRNNELDKNFLGIPKEKYGFSNNPSNWFRAPKFGEAAITIKEGKANSFHIKLK